MRVSADVTRVAGSRYPPGMRNLLIALGALVMGPLTSMSMASAVPSDGVWEEPFERSRSDVVHVRSLASLETSTSTSTATLGSSPRRVRLVNHSAWSWYMDPRVLETGASTIVGGVSTSGSVTLTRFSHSSGTVTRATLQSGMNDDDHNAPALMELPDGRVMAMWSGHGRHPLRYRITSSKDSLTRMSAATPLRGSGLESTGASYVHLLRQDDHPQPYIALTRRSSDDMWVMTRSADLVTWTPAVQLLARVHEKDQHHPYLKFAMHGDAIHVLATDRHPFRGSTSLYHFVLRGERVERTDGSLIMSLPELEAGRPVTVSEATLVYDGSSADGRPRVYDIMVGQDGIPRIGVTTSASSNFTFKWGIPKDHGAGWQLRTLARQSGTLPAGMSLDSGDPTRVLLARMLDRPGLVEYRTPDDTWTAGLVTKMSGLRTPTTPYGNGGPMGALWMGGRYDRYDDYDTQVWGLTSGVAPVELVSTWSRSWDDGGVVVVKLRAGVSGPDVRDRVVRLRVRLPGGPEETVRTARTDAYGNARLIVPDLPVGARARVLHPKSDGWGYATTGTRTADS